MALTRRTVLAGASALGASMSIKRARAANEPIKIGFNGELSGPVAPVGLPNRLGAEAARNIINQNGGIDGRQIELVMLDNAGNANRPPPPAMESTKPAQRAARQTRASVVISIKYLS